MIVNRDFTKRILVNDSGLGCLLTLVLGAILLTSVGLGWIVNGFLILLVILAILPILAFWGARWWLKRNIVEDACPVCQYSFMGFNQAECRCPNCGEPLKVEGNHFHRIIPPGTIDVEAIEVQSQILEGE